jgi:hypothetical protein
MDLIERLRPKWRSPDPEVRAAAAREMGAEDGERLAALAESDPDARVRRIAVKKVDDPALIRRVAEGDADPAIRVLANEHLGEVLLRIATSDAPADDCAAALAGLTDQRSLGSVAAGARHDGVRRAALARVAGDRALRDVVRAAADPAIRAAALERIEDRTILRAIALGDGSGELALQALERIDDVAVLQAIAGAATSKSVRQRARALATARGAERPPIGIKAARARQLELCTLVQGLRSSANADPLRAAEYVRDAQQEWAALAREVEPRPDVAEPFATACAAVLDDAASLERRMAAADHARMEHEENVEARTALCEQVEALDGAEAGRALAAARAAWSRLPHLDDQAGAALWRRFAAAGDACTARHRAWIAGDRIRAAIAALVEEAEAMAGATPTPKPKRWKELERRWTARDAGSGDVVAALEARFAAAGERLRRRWEEGERERAEADRENLARLEALEARVRELAAAEAIKSAAGRRELQAVEDALRELGPLPPTERRAAWQARLGEAHDALLRRIAQAEQTEEWRRWANASAQEELIARVEALLESNDLAEGTRQLGGLQEEWAKIATATPDKSQALWERFRSARNELRKRCDAWLAANLEQKRALCAQVAGVGESSTWNETTDLLRRLQAEWKAIGPVPGKHAKAIWQQFHEPCERFFARRKEHFDRIDATRRENADRKTALCEQAEALADSTDWEATTTAVKRLQAEWKESGPPPRDQADALWQRFRTACDRFFDRRNRRGELAREETLRKAEAICAALDGVAQALADADAPPPDDAGQRIDEAWAEWVRLELADTDRRTLGERLHGLCARIAAVRPDLFRGTRLDPDTTGKRREKLVARLESLGGGAEDGPRERTVQELALALRDRLASNTIAGSGKDGARRQDVARELERITASWDVLGPALDERARGLVERFERARARVRVAR